MIKKISINELKYFPEWLYIAERECLVKSKALNIKELETYDGSKIGGKWLDYKELYSIILNENFESEKIDSKLINSQNYGSYNFDIFVVNDYKIINGIIDKNMPSKFFYDLVELLKELKVKKWFFISKIKPPVNGYLHCCKTRKFGLDYYYVCRFYDPEGIHTIQRKVYTCVNCQTMFLITDQERQYFRNRDLKLPKRCNICRKATKEIKNERSNSKE